MNQTECARETDVVDAVTSGRWPERADAGLRAHVAGCAICADVAEVARALQDDHDAAWRDARVPSAGRVWWRAEMRARQEAARKAAQPMAFVQAGPPPGGGGGRGAGGGGVWGPPGARGGGGGGGGVGAAACGGGGLIALVVLFWPALRASVGAIAASSFSTVLPEFGLPLAIAIGSMLLLVPIALYFVFSEK